MNNPIGILNQIKEIKTYNISITKEYVFNTCMDSFKDFYEEYPYALKWDYEKFIREMLDYYD